MRRRSQAILAALALTLAACGGGGGDDEDATATDESTTSTTAEGDTPVEVDVSEETDAGTAIATTAPPTTAAPSAGGSSDVAAPASADAPTPLTPGTYRYRQSGSASGGGQSYDAPEEGTLVADPPEADGRQLLHRYIDPKGKPNDNQMRYGADGIFLLQTTLRQGEAEITCTFDPPLPTPSWPPAVGGTHAGKASCGGELTVDVKGSITGTREVEIDGQKHQAFVVDTTITTSGPVQSTTHQIDWFVQALRMSVHTESNTSGKFGEVTFESTGVSDLISAIPS